MCSTFLFSLIECYITLLAIRAIRFWEINVKVRTEDQYQSHACRVNMEIAAISCVAPAPPWATYPLHCPCCFFKIGHSPPPPVEITNLSAEPLGIGEENVPLSTSGELTENRLTTPSMFFWPRAVLKPFCRTEPPSLNDFDSESLVHSFQGCCRSPLLSQLTLVFALNTWRCLYEKWFVPSFKTLPVSVPVEHTLKLFHSAITTECQSLSCTLFLSFSLFVSPSLPLILAGLSQSICQLQSH